MFSDGKSKAWDFFTHTWIPHLLDLCLGGGPYLKNYLEPENLVLYRFCRSYDFLCFFARSFILKDAFFAPSSKKAWL